MGFQTYEFTSSIDTDEYSVIKLIRLLNTSEAHGFDEISTRILKICNSAISKPLLQTLENCISAGEFFEFWKKSKYGASS